jgi:hypothetical protein
MIFRVTLSKASEVGYVTRDFQIYSPVQTDSFALAVAESHPLLSAFAADVNRLAIACLESAISVARTKGLPRSTAWTNPTIPLSSPHIPF